MTYRASSVELNGPTPMEERLEGRSGVSHRGDAPGAPITVPTWLIKGASSVP